VTFKPSVWHPIAVLLSIANLVAVGFAMGEPLHATGHVALAVGFALWAQHLRQKRGGSEVDAMKDQLDQQAAALEDAQNTLASQSAQIAELHERLDFAERVLAQARDRQALSPRDDRA
jgi:hypothetical protein